MFLKPSLKPGGLSVEVLEPFDVCGVNQWNSNNFSNVSFLVDFRVSEWQEIFAGNPRVMKTWLINEDHLFYLALRRHVTNWPYTNAMLFMHRKCAA